jgi:hypothetical protein
LACPAPAFGQKGNALSQQAKQALQVSFIAGQHIKGHQHHRCLLRRQHAGLVLP